MCFEDINLVGWNDNNVVTLCSNALGLESIGQAKLWKGLFVNIDQPCVIKQYNDCMGGVDLVDRALSDYRPEIHGKKWYRSLFVNAIILLCVFTWCIHEISNDKEVPKVILEIKWLVFF